MEKEIIKLKDSIEALNSTSKDMKVSFHYTDKEIDAIKTVVEAAENYLEMKKEYKKLVNDRDLAVKTYERQAKELNHIGYFLIETLGYTMQEVMVIADTSLEIQDVNRKLKELKKINEEATFEDAREEITKDMYEEYCNKFDDIVLNKDFKKSAIIKTSL